MEESYGTVSKELVLPVQKFNRDLAEIGEISARFVLSQRSRRDLGENFARVCIGYVPLAIFVSSVSLEVEFSQVNMIIL